MSGVMFDKILGRIREGGDEGGGGDNYALIENTPQIITPSVDGSIANLTAQEIESLRPGDVVIDNTVANHVRAFIVLDKKDNNPEEVSLVHFTSTSDLMMKWAKSNNNWSYHIGGFDFTSFAGKIRTANAQPVVGMAPNTLYNLGELTADTTFLMGGAQDNTIVNIWYWTFSTGATAPTITWPQQITMWADGEAPAIEANKHYEISVMNGMATVTSAETPQS